MSKNKKAKSSPKAYATITPRKGGFKKPSAKGFRGYSYREY